MALLQLGGVGWGLAGLFVGGFKHLELLLEGLETIVKATGTDGRVDRRKREGGRTET